MKHFMLKFNHGVEIGAKLAYYGHFRRTGEAGIYKIIQEERIHQQHLYDILKSFNEKPSDAIDTTFVIIGNIISYLCKFCPLFMLDFVARTMEKFAVFNYKSLAKKYPKYQSVFEEMVSCEQRHDHYFSRSA